MAVLALGKESKLAAKDLVAATNNNTDHRPTTTATAGVHCNATALRARAGANNRTSWQLQSATNFDANNDQAGFAHVRLPPPAQAAQAFSAEPGQ